MPAEPFRIHPNLDDLARQDIAAALSGPARRTGRHDQPDDTAETAHHGAQDTRQAARARSDRARAGRAASAGGGRSYAFRRS